MTVHSQVRPAGLTLPSGRECAKSLRPSRTELYLQIERNIKSAIERERSAAFKNKTPNLDLGGRGSFSCVTEFTEGTLFVCFFMISKEDVVFVLSQ